MLEKEFFFHKICWQKFFFLQKNHSTFKLNGCSLRRVNQQGTQTFFHARGPWCFYQHDTMRPYVVLLAFVPVPCFDKFWPVPSFNITCIFYTQFVTCNAHTFLQSAHSTASMVCASSNEDHLGLHFRVTNQKSADKILSCGNIKYREISNTGWVAISLNKFSFSENLQSYNLTMYGKSKSLKAIEGNFKHIKYLSAVFLNL